MINPKLEDMTVEDWLNFSDSSSNLADIAMTFMNQYFSSLEKTEEELMIEFSESRGNAYKYFYGSGEQNS